MTFLNLKPVLNKKDQDKILKIESMPYNELYQDALEEQIFSGVKTRRKQDAMPALKFNQEKVNSYSQLAINKYKIESPLAGSVRSSSQEPTGAGATFSEQPLEFKSRAERGMDATQDLPTVLRRSGEAIKTGAGEFASSFMGAVDVPLQQFAKGFVGATVLPGAAYYNAQEFGNELKQTGLEFLALGSAPFREEGTKIGEKFEEADLSKAFLKAGEKTEALLTTSEWFFGTKMEWGDYLDVRSSHEKRTELFSQMPTSQQEMLKPLENYTLAFDVIAGITSGLGASKIPLTLANKVGPLTVLGKSMTALDTALDVTIKQMPKLGVAYGAAALLYYQQTGKWLFEGDEGATEGTAMFMVSAGLKGLGKLGKKGWELSKGGREYISKVLADGDFQKGVSKYFDEAKNVFADEVGKFATKVGAKTNLLPEGKILEEMQDVRNIKVDDFLNEKVFDGSVEKTRGDILNEAKKTFRTGLESSTQKNIGVKSKLIDKGFIKEGESLVTGLRRGFKAKITGSFIKQQDEIFGELAGDKGVSKFLRPADRKIANALEQTRASGQIGLIQQKFDKVAKSVDDLEEFNNYLFAKSRYFKTRGKDVATKLYDEKTGKLIDVSPIQLETTYKALDAKYGQLADEIYAEYDSLLTRELDAGIRTPEDLANFKANNPAYIGDKVLNVEEMLKTGPDKLNINMPKKNLAQNAEEALSNDALNNAYNEMIYRTEILNRVEKLKLAKDASEGMGLITKLKEGATPDRGNIRFKLYEDGKLVDYQGPKFWIEDIFTDDRVTKKHPIVDYLTAPAKYLTRMFKETTTGRLNPLYQVVAPLFETPAAIMRMLSEAGFEKNGGRTEFFKTLFRTQGALDKNPATADAMSSLADFMGATFTQSKQFKKEISDTLGNEFKRYSALKSSFMKGKEMGTKVLDTIDIGNIIERKTTRLPLFNSQLAKQGITKKTLDGIVVEAKGSPSKMKKLLEKEGVDVEAAAGVATNFFDYLGITRLSNEIGQFIPYFNSAMSFAKSSKKLIEANPKMFMGMLGTGFYASSEIEKFNTNTPEKKARYEQMPDYRKNVPMLYFGVNEEGEDVFVKIARGLQPLEWAYPLYMQAKSVAEGNGFDFTNAFGKVFEDTSGITLNPKDWGKYLPTIIKKPIEYATGFDFFSKRNSSATASQKEYKTLHFNKNTSNVAVGLSRLIATQTGGKEGDDGVVRGGIQMSPIAIDKTFETFDSGTIRGLLGKMFTEANQTGKIDDGLLQKAINIFVKTNKAGEFEDDIFGPKGVADAEIEIRNNRITSEINDATNETLSDVVKNLIQDYPGSKTSIISKMKNKKIEESVKGKVSGKGDPFKAGTLIRLSKMSNEELAFNYISKRIEEDEEAANNFLKELAKAGLINVSRIINIRKKVLLIDKNEDIEVK